MQQHVKHEKNTKGNKRDGNTNCAIGLIAEEAHDVKNFCEILDRYIHAFFPLRPHCCIFGEIPEPESRFVVSSETLGTCQR
jgi:hypothetical protein